MENPLEGQSAEVKDAMTVALYKLPSACSSGMAPDRNVRQQKRTTLKVVCSKTCHDDR
jgi:hypothetical protein